MTNTSFFNHTGYGPLPFWDDLANYTLFNNREFVIPIVEERESERPLSPATLGLATSVLFILTCGSNKTPVKPQWIVWTIILLSALVILLPIICTLVVYKMLANFCLRGRILKGSDAVWALDWDTEASLSVINILALVSGDINIQHVKQVVEEKLVPTHAKLKNLRQYSVFGYFFWKDQQNFNLDNYVKLLDCECEGKVATEEELRNILSNLSNAKLPHNHLAGWEICLGPKLSLDDHIHRAIIFRVHHSLGDGPALFRALLTTLATNEDQQLLNPDPDVIKRLLTRVRARSTDSFMDSAVDVGRSLRDAFVLPPDKNILHGPRLSGKKQLAWCSSSQLMLDAKKIRSETGATFSAGLVASFLAAVAKYGSHSDALASCSIVMPVRVPSRNVGVANEMSNAFTMSIVRSKLPHEEEDVLSQVMSVDKALKRATKPAILVSNGFIIKLIGDLCPRPLASMALGSRQCTAAISNMPGPQEKISLFGSQLEKLVFWVPNKDATGVSASILSYAGELTLGLSIDSALLQELNGANTLVHIWATQLSRMAAELSTMH